MHTTQVFYIALHNAQPPSLQSNSQTSLWKVLQKRLQLNEEFDHSRHVIIHGIESGMRPATAALKSNSEALHIRFPPRVPRGRAAVMESRSRLSLSPPVTLYLSVES